MNEILQARRDVKRIADKYHILVPVVTVERSIIDECGKVINFNEALAKSWTRNGINLLSAQLGMCRANQVGSTTVFGDGLISIKDSYGTMASTLTSNAPCMDASYTTGLSDAVLIGTGTTAESINQYALTSEIPGGSGAGKMTRQLMSWNSVWTAVSRTMRTTITRQFVNNSGGTINVTESGLFVITGAALTTSGTAYSVMVQHDVFDPDVVSNGKTYTVTYKFDVVYPAA